MDNFEIRGHVTLIDEKNDKVLFDGDNMILLNGRRIFFDFLLRTLLNRADELNSDANYIGKRFPDSEQIKIDAIFFGVSDSATTSTYALLENTTEEKTISDAMAETTAGGPLTISWFIDNEESENERYGVKFEKTINSNFLSGLNYITEIGLRLSDTLPFSRVLIPKIPIEDDSEFKLIYYIYM